MKKMFLLIALLLVFCGFLQDTDVVLSGTMLDNDTVSLIFSGDIMGHSPQFKAAYDPITKTYNYNVCFQHVKSYIENADFAIANLEIPLAGAPYSGYPNFSSPDALLDALKNAGYDILLTANNHVNDRRKAGLERTIHVINDRKLKYAGSYINKTQRDSIYPLIMEQKGVRIALLNCTYGTNGNPVHSPNIVNMIDTVQIKKDIKKAEALNVDLIVMTIHWGNEYELKGNVEQQKLSQLFVREGIDLVIGGHPHVVQNAAFMTKNSSVVPVFYSLGNSVSNQRKPNTDGGIMVKIKIGVQSKKIISASYLPVYVHKGVLNDKFQYYLIPTIDFIKSPSTFSIPSNDSLSLIYFDRQTRLNLQNVSVLDEVFEY